MITALIGHRGVEKTALRKSLEILCSRREDVIRSNLDFEIENRAGRSIASISTIEAPTAIAKGPARQGLRQQRGKAGVQFFDNTGRRKRPEKRGLDAMSANDPKRT